MGSSVRRAVLTAGLVVGATSAVAQLAPGPQVRPGGESPRGDVTRIAPGGAPQVTHKPPAGRAGFIKAPAALPPNSPADKARTAPAATRPPIDKARAIVIPRENCGSFWTPWGSDPNANPCPANCERGERLDLREQKTADGMRYQANYRCSLPELVVNPPPAASRGPGAPPRTNCGTFWTARQSKVNAEANPCPANCERGELLDVRRSRSGDKVHYEMNYRCYVAQPKGTAPTPSATQAPAGTQTSSSGPAPAAAQTEQTTAPSGSTPAPVPAAKATARLNLAPVYRAALGGGSLTVGGNRVGIGLYATMDASSSYALRISPDSGGRLRVRATVSNVQGATTLLMESAAGSSSCPLARSPGYNSFQTCDLAFDLPAAREVQVTVRKPRDTVTQVAVVKFDVTREAPAGGVQAAAQVVLSGPQAAFDQLPGAKVNAAASPVGTAAHVTLSDNSTVAVNLIGAPAGTYRFRAMISNTSAPVQFSVQAAGQQSTCSVPATPGYQGAAPCEIVISVPAPGTNQTVSFTKRAGGAPEVTIDTVYVYQE